MGFLITGIATNSLWMAGDLSMETILDCESLKRGWDDICQQIGIYYYIGKIVITISGFVVPFFIVRKILRS